MKAVWSLQSVSTTISPYAWDEAQKEILLAFTGQSAIAIQNARLFSEIKRRAAQQEALNKIIAEAVKAPDLAYLVETVLDLTLEVFDCKMGGLWLSGFSALRGLSADLKRAEKEIGQAQGAQFQNTVAIDDWQQIDSQTSPWRQMMDDFQIRASISAPVISGGQRIGGLAIVTSSPRQWQPDEITHGRSHRSAGGWRC